MATGDTKARLAALLEAPIAAMGLDLEAVDLTSAGKRSVLRVAVDQDGGVSLDDIADATRVVSDLLDDADVLGETPYTLEVSSPGLDRPLTLPRHWRRNVERLVAVTSTAGETFTGRIMSSDEESVVLRLDDKDATSIRTVLFVDVARAKIEIEFKTFAGFEDEE